MEGSDGLRLEAVELRLLAVAECIDKLMEFEAADHDRLLRIESMLRYQMESQPEDVVTTPSLEQAKQLAALGLPPWPRVKVATNRYELWKRGFADAMARKLQEEPPHV